MASVMGLAWAEIEATIANAGQTSTEIDLGTVTVCGIELPAPFTGTSLTFQVSRNSGGTYKTMMVSGTTYTETVAQDRFISLDPSIFAGVRWLKVVSGSAEAAERTIVVVGRKLA